MESGLRGRGLGKLVRGDMLRIVSSLVLACGLLLTAACESSEERAQQHFENGVALLEAGDVDRALVEFRNVFRLDGTHREARRAYAQAEISRGQYASGYSQYLRLVEQYPDDIPARRELTRLALERGEWSEVEKHATFLIEAQPEDDVARLADLAMRYRSALDAEDAAARAEVVADTIALSEEMPENALLHEMLADHYAREDQREDALAEIQLAIDAGGDLRRLYGMRIGLLQQMGDLDAVESTLVEMVELFPEDQTVAATLLRWYISRDQLDEAEAYLRARADTGDSAQQIDLVRFLIEYRGREAGLEELDSLIEADAEDAPLFRSVRAGLTFEAGRQEEAISELQTLIDEAPEETDQLRNVKVALARMLQETGNSVGARSLIEDVLSSDANHAEALRMRAAWLIEADETDDAILALRTALEQNPRDPSLMTAMAQAYERAGNRALMAEMLSLAVEVSNRAPAETLTYVRYLDADGKTDVAERALVESLRLNPGNAQLLQYLGSLYAREQDWGRTRQVIDSLEEIDSSEAKAAANALQAEVLTGQGRNEEVVDYLEDLIDRGEGGIGAQVAIVRTHIQNGNLDAAMEYVENELARDPDNASLRFLKGSVLQARGENEKAEAIFSSMTEENPRLVLAWRTLYLMQQQQGRAEEAQATLDAALEQNPNSPDLQWIKASLLQRDGDLEAALEVYAAMYERNSSAPVIANNYASLLTTLRDDEESIERAYAVARRLRDADVPAFQDTFGWIAYLRGDVETAIDHLEPAAEALADDPSVQYHLAMAYDAAGRAADAAEALQRAIDLAEQGARLPEIDTARQKLAELQAPAD